jgi:hypothetical protein
MHQQFQLRSNCISLAGFLIPAKCVRQQPGKLFFLFSLLQLYSIDLHKHLTSLQKFEAERRFIFWWLHWVVPII